MLRDELSQSPSILTSVRVVDVVTVEDVLVLVGERVVRHVHLIYLTDLRQPGPPAAVDEPVEVKSVPFICLGGRRRYM